MFRAYLSDDGTQEGSEYKRSNVEAEREAGELEALPVGLEAKEFPHAWVHLYVKVGILDIQASHPSA